jgi:hypothetical protein
LDGLEEAGVREEGFEEGGGDVGVDEEAEDGVVVFATEEVREAQDGGDVGGGRGRLR